MHASPSASRGRRPAQRGRGGLAPRRAGPVRRRAPSPRDGERSTRRAACDRRRDGGPWPPPRRRERDDDSPDRASGSRGRAPRAAVPGWASRLGPGCRAPLLAPTRALRRSFRWRSRTPGWRPAPPRPGVGTAPDVGPGGRRPAGSVGTRGSRPGAGRCPSGSTANSGGRPRDRRRRLPRGPGRRRSLLGRRPAATVPSRPQPGRTRQPGRRLCRPGRSGRRGRSCRRRPAVRGPRPPGGGGAPGGRPRARRRASNARGHA